MTNKLTPANSSAQVAFQRHQLEQLSQQANEQQQLEWLSSLNEKGRDAFAKAPWPTRKTEAFKYCPLKSLGDSEATASSSATLIEVDELNRLTRIPELDAYRLVLVNGRINASLSDAMVLSQVTPLSQATEVQQAQTLKQLLDTQSESVNPNGVNRHLFNDLNDASLNTGSGNEGVLIQLNKNQQLDKPIQLCHISRSTEAQAITSRVLVTLETGSELTLIEHFCTLSEEDQSLTNAQTEVLVGNNARLNHYRLQLTGSVESAQATSNSRHIGSSWIKLGRDANYQGFHMGMGSQLSRNDLVVRHTQGGSHAEIAGIYAPKGKELIDFHTCIEHEVAHCTSNEVFRGIVNDASKAVFHGRIHIHKDAQKTYAELSNKNLLLTNKAEVNTKPELEIYADDVQCAHGATVAQLDDKARFYLQSRGISEQEAKVMLSFGFINELLDGLKDEAIGNWLRPMLARRFGREPLFSAEDIESSVNDGGTL